MKWYKLQSTDAPGRIAKRVLGALLDRGTVRGVMVGAGLGSGEPVHPALVSKSRYLDGAVVFSPHMLINSAAQLARLTNDDSALQVGAVLKPCEHRAFVELVKFSQADRSYAVTITTDCLGTVDTDQPEAVVASDDGPVLAPPVEKLRPACAICTDMDVTGDLHLGFIGTDEGLMVGVNDDQAESDERVAQLCEAIESIGARPATDDELTARNEALNVVRAERQEARDARVAEIYEEFDDLSKLAKRFASCRQCFNCREACPICYCRECLFEGPVFEPESVRYVRMADKRGVLPLPVDVLLFHITRMNHMVLSCVGCGQCTAACPNDLPVAELFSAFGERARAIFDYHPGLSYDDPPPLSTFREDELEAVTEPTEKVMSR